MNTFNVFNWIYSRLGQVFTRGSLRTTTGTIFYTGQMPFNMILTAPPPDNWKRPPGLIHITWLNTIQQDLRAYNLTLNEAVDRPLWKLMSTYGATHS